MGTSSRSDSIVKQLQTITACVLFRVMSHAVPLYTDHRCVIPSFDLYQSDGIAPNRPHERPKHTGRSIPQTNNRISIKPVIFITAIAITVSGTRFANNFRKLSGIICLSSRFQMSTTIQGCLHRYVRFVELVYVRRKIPNLSDWKRLKSFQFDCLHVT